MPVKFHAFLKALRLRAGYGLRQFAEMIGESPSNYAGVESGRRPPWRRAKLLIVAQALGLAEGSPDWDTFFMAAGRHTTLPPDLEPILELPGIPQLLRTVDECNLSNDQLRELCKYLERKHKKGKPK